MKYISLFAIILVIGSASCKSKTEAISRSQMKARVDSLVAIKLQEINTQAMEDLDRRMAIEVKAKTDSLVQVCMGVVDTTK